jgi:hypothetical protein
MLVAQTTNAPSSVIPDMALVADIKGVCSCDGTLEISSRPRNTASTNTNSSNISSIVFSSFELKVERGKLKVIF